MADMDIERRPRRGGGSWVWWLVGALVIVLLIWWWVGDWGSDNDDVAMGDQTTEQVAPAPVTSPAPVSTSAAIPISDILSDPQTYTGQSFSGDVMVAEAPTARGFWIRDDASGERMFVVVTQETAGQPLSVQADQHYTLRNATVRDPSTLDTTTGQPLDQETRDIVKDQPVVLTVSATDLQPSTGTAGQPATPGTYDNGTEGGGSQDDGGL